MEQISLQGKYLKSSPNGRSCINYPRVIRSLPKSRNIPLTAYSGVKIQPLASFFTIFVDTKPGRQDKQSIFPSSS